MSLNAQAKVLRSLQNQEIRRVGGKREIKVDLRVICASHKDLQEEVKKGTFREDLFYRISVVRITLPPLRERPGDIPALVETFVSQCCTRNGLRLKTVDSSVMSVLKKHAWPGNVRELDNLVQRLVIMSGSKNFIHRLTGTTHG